MTQEQTTNQVENQDQLSKELDKPVAENNIQSNIIRGALFCTFLGMATMSSMVCINTLRGWFKKK